MIILILMTKFCSINKEFYIENGINNCKNKCTFGCYEEYYNFDDIYYIQFDSDVDIRLTDYSFYIIYIYLPLMTFESYLISIGGLMGLWHGIHLLQIRDKF